MEETVFLNTLKRIRWITDRDELTKVATTTLKLLLRRPSDQELLATLLTQIDAITSQLPPGGAANQRSAAVRQAAVRCVVLLQSAKHGRLTRRESDQVQARRRRRRVHVVLAATVATGALYAVLLRPAHKTPMSPSEIAEQMAEALRNSPLGVSQRGDIRIHATPSHIIVTIERLSTEDCITAAEKIQSKIPTQATLMINDTEVGRSTPEKLVRLCVAAKESSLTVTRADYRKR